MKIGIDIGVSKILGISFLKNKILKEKTITTPKTKREFINKLSFLIEDLTQKNFLEGIGISVCGIVSQGKIVRVPNLCYLEKIPLKNLLQKRFKTKIKIENDLNCFLIAEKKLGILKNKKNAVLIGLGSGLGGAILIEGKIYRGTYRGAGEIGHCIINFSTLTFSRFPSPISHHPLLTIEDLCSEKWFKKNKFGNSKELFEKAKKKDRKSKRIFKEYGKNLGIVIANLVNLFDPELILLCGGISNASQFFLKEAELTAKKLIISPIAKKNMKISLTKFKEKGAAIGATFLI